MSAPARRFRASSPVARKACPVSSSLRRAGSQSRARRGLRACSSLLNSPAVAVRAAGAFSEPLSGGVSVGQLDRPASFYLACCGFESCQTHHPNAATININMSTARRTPQGRLLGFPRWRAETRHSPLSIAAFNPSGNGAGYSARMVRAPVTSAEARDWWAFDDLPRIAKDMTAAGRLFLPKHKLAGASVPAIFRSAA